MPNQLELLMKKSLSSELLISISAIIIALTSIVVSVWEGNSMRNHYQLSVQPRLNYSFESEIFPDDDEYNFSSALFKIKNNGLGPAIIMSIEYFIDGEIIDTNECSECLDILFNKRFNFDNLGGHAYSTLLVGQTIPMNESLTIYEYNFLSEEAFHRQSKEFYHRLSFIFKYQSLYGEEFEISHNMDKVDK